jgi:uncharacterized protein YhjY with autotransporter beta-barrel domain
MKNTPPAIPSLPRAERPARPRVAGPSALLALGLAALPHPAPAEALAGLPGLTPYQASLAAALDQACPEAGGALALRCRELENLDPAQQTAAILSLTPYQFLPQTGMPIKAWPSKVPTRPRRKAPPDARNPSAPTGALDGGLAPVSLEWTGGGSGDEASGDEPLSLFLQGKFQSIAKSRALSSFDADSYTVTLGGDYRFSDRSVAGLAFIYGRTDTVMTRHSGTMESDIFRATVFGNYSLPEDFYIDGFGIYSRYENDLRRNLSYPGYRGKTTSTPDADLYSAALTLGRDFAWRAWLLNPYVRFEYSHLHLDGYREQGGQGLAYEVGAQSDDSVTGTPGLQLSYAASLPWGVLTPSLRFEYEHQFANANRRIDLRLAEAPAGTGYFFLPTGRPDRDYYNLGGGLTATFPGGSAAFLRYEARLAQDPISSHLVELGVRVPF